MKKFLLISGFLIVAFFASDSVTAQVTQEWVQNYNSGSNYNDIVNDMEIDKFGNIYLTGYSNTSTTGDDFVTLKYSPQGVLQWVRNYNGSSSGSDRAIKVLVDDSGYVFVGGVTFDSVSLSNYLIIKYAPNGDTIWIRELDGGENSTNSPRDMVLDDSSNVYITGTSQDYMTAKYDRNGNLKWVKFYGGTSGDIPLSIALDNKNNVIITGQSYNTSFDIATVKYNNEGSFLWNSIINGKSNEADVGEIVKTDLFDNIYVGGTIKNNFQNRNDIIIIKYDSAGSVLWQRIYGSIPNPPMNPNDYLSSMILSFSNENIYLTGLSKLNSQVGWDYLILKYNSEGDTLWKRGYKPNFNSDNQSRHITIDKYENIYITGSSNFNTPHYRFLTVKFDSSGNLIWSRNYFDYALADNYGIRVLLDSSGNVYVGGISYNLQTGADITLIKYSQPMNIKNVQEIISSFELYQNYPNPFNPSTTIKYTIPESSKIKISIFDLLGKEAAVLIDDIIPAGSHEIIFNTNDYGNKFSSGVYFYRLISENNIILTKKFLLLK
jgi:hypothetical protein